MARLLVGQLALDDDERHALVGHLGGVGVAQLMRGKAPSHAGVSCGSAELGAGRGA
jgi:hypothetical protein